MRATKDKIATAVNMMVGMSIMMEAKMLVPKKTIVPNQPLGKQRVEHYLLFIYLFVFIQYVNSHSDIFLYIYSEMRKVFTSVCRH